MPKLQLPKLQVAKITSCRNWKLQKLQIGKFETDFSIFLLKVENFQNCKLPKLKVITISLLKVNIFDELSWKFPKLQDAEIEMCQHWKLPKLKVGKVESDFSISC